MISDILVMSSKFLNEVCLLRQQKGKYLCADFSTKLEGISYEVVNIIHQNLGFRRVISDQPQYRKKISDNVVDLCLECIETDLQNIQSVNYSLQMILDQTLPILIDISNDLRSIAAYIKFTINPDNPHDPAPVSAKHTNNHARNSA